jgi:hypothetical protein
MLAWITTRERRDEVVKSSWIQCPDLTRYEEQTVDILADVVLVTYHM